MFHMFQVEYQGTIWEINEEIMGELVDEGIVEDLSYQLGYEEVPHPLTDKFRENWGHKTYEAFNLAVAIFQAAAAVREGNATAESESAQSNLADAVVILKGERV